MIHIGFTGTQHGVTGAQLNRVAHILGRWERVWPGVCLHHGDCLGADQQAHQIARGLGMRIEGHPPLNPAKRAWCEFDVQCDAETYLARNRAIVKATAHLLAAPATPHEQLRSGTWATIRYARQQNQEITIVGPDGTVVRIP